MFSLAHGAFLVLGIIIAIINYKKINNNMKSELTSCNNNCLNCNMINNGKGDE